MFCGGSGQDGVMGEMKRMVAELRDPAVEVRDTRIRDTRICETAVECLAPLVCAVRLLLRVSRASQVCRCRP